MLSVRPPFSRLPTPIGRATQEETLRRYAALASAEAQCYLLRFEAGGGMGKSHLLAALSTILNPQGPQYLIPKTVDFYNFTTRHPRSIEQTLINGLKEEMAEEVERLFQPYAEAVTRYKELVQRGRITEEDEKALLRTFVACWNNLTASHPTVISFDTFETLFQEEAPPGALIKDPSTSTSAELVINWMKQVFPQLKATLVVICGRPPETDAQADEREIVLKELWEGGLPITPLQTLEPFEDEATIREFLDQYQVTLSGGEALWIRHITEGRPLLLACFAETRRPEHGIPPPLGGLGEMHDRPSFEDWLVGTILNPHRADIVPLSQKTLNFCLYFLVSARRGVEATELEELFRKLDTEYDPEVIQNLHRVSLVKQIGERFYLHDEIFLIIDTSAQATAYGYDGPTLEYLAEISAKRVHRARNNSVALVGAMSDHMYYELRRDFQRGYYAYSIYMDWLLGERRIDEALVLADAFWSTLRQNEDLLREAPLTQVQIIEDEQLRLVKLMRARDQSEEALQRVVALSAGGSTAPIAISSARDAATQQRHYTEIDRDILHAHLLGLVRPEGQEAQIEAIYQRVLERLDRVQAVPDDNAGLLILRRPYLLGHTLMLRGFFRRQRRNEQQARADYERARQALKEYREQTHLLGGREQTAEQYLNDHTAPALAQLTNNLAYILLLSGDLRLATLLSDEVLKRYIAEVSAYHRALFFNTHARIQLRSNQLIKAKNILGKAEEEANISHSKRARALVGLTRGLLERSFMKSHQTPDNGRIYQHYQELQSILPDESSLLYEYYYDWAGYVRDVAILHRAQGSLEEARTYFAEAHRLLEECASRLSPDEFLRRADLLESRATILNEEENYKEAARFLDEAELLMTQPMSSYGQVISGKIALQRGFISLKRDQDYLKALHHMTLALARAYVYGQKHRDEQIFSDLIQHWIEEIPAASLRQFHETLEERPQADQLLYQPVEAESWEKAWNFSVTVVRESIDARLLAM